MAPYSRPTSLTLTDLSDFLRAIWLECCGHLRAFTIQGERYSDNPVDDDIWGGESEQSADIPLSKILKPGLSFEYEYDFGSTTELALKVIAPHELPAKKNQIQILARNASFDYPCFHCGGHATQVCSGCIYDAAVFPCEKCTRHHECDAGPDMFISITNSPRMGICGYSFEGLKDADNYK